MTTFFYLSSRASDFVLCECGDLEFRTRAKPLSNFSPKEKNKKYSNARSFAKSAQDDKNESAQDDTLSVILNEVKNLALMVLGRVLRRVFHFEGVD